MRLRDKTAIITGATSGIGKATAERFVSEGARVAVVGRNDEEGRAAEREMQELAARQRAGDVGYFHADVARSQEVRQAVAAIVERWGRVDILVNNAGVMTFTRIKDLEETDWDLVLGVNLTGAFLFARYCLPHMPPGSAIVNVSSVHASATEPTVVPYAASKGGLEAFTRGLASSATSRRSA